MVHAVVQMVILYGYSAVFATLVLTSKYLCIYPALTQQSRHTNNMAVVSHEWMQLCKCRI